MIWKRNLNISHDFINSAWPIFWGNRIFGVAPLSIKKRKTHYVIKWSFLLTIYSSAIALISAGLTVYSIKEDGAEPAKESTTKYVVLMNRIVIQLIIVIGIFGAPFRFNSFYSFLKYITEVDTIMPILDTNRAVYASFYTLFTVLITVLIPFGTKCYSMLYQNSNIIKDLFINIHEALAYCIVVMLECQFWYMTLTIQRRICLLNHLLTIDTSSNNNQFRPRNVQMKANNSSRVDEIDRTNVLINDFFYKKGKLFKSVENEIQEELIFVKNASILTKVYMNLCNAVDNVNDICGLFISIMIVLDLLHLTISGYFVIVNMQNNVDVGLTVLTGLTFLAYLYRLIFIVEPCEDCVKQVKQTSLLVCRLLCSDVDVLCKEQLNIFHNQLLQRKIEFSAYGFGNMDRSVITTIAATVTVYLVAIVQFKISEE